MSPKVSVVVPVFNVQSYLAECLDSLIQQTLQDIQIIVVNDGSTDNSLAIAQQYASQDSRIAIIDKENGGYGHSMNRGIEAAQGDYIGIVESDDCARPAMFEKLYEQACIHDADIVRSNYFTMAEKGTKFEVIDVLGISEAPYYQSISPQDYPLILRGSPAIWTGIYKTDFLRSNDISFLESPGASYQDTGFFLKAITTAQTMVLVREAYLNYRIDNESSSVKSGAKAFCVYDEYASFEQFLAKYPQREQAFRFVLPAKKYETYLWNYNRLDMSLRPDFLELMTKEFRAAWEKGDLNAEYFAPIEWEELQKVMFDPQAIGGKNLTVVPAKIDEDSRLKTLEANGMVSKLQSVLLRAKRVLR